MYPMTLEQDRGDVLVKNVLATAFGGDFDPGDNGETASGIRTKGNPTIMGVALPMNSWHQCKSSPIPKLPWKTKVIVTCQRLGTIIEAVLIDVGPSEDLKSGACIDLTPASFLALVKRANNAVNQKWAVKVGSEKVNFRIVGVASLIFGTQEESGT